MKTQSFEYDLQQMETPVPEPAARERARQAAVEEFLRTRGTVHRLPAPGRWNSRSTWWSGLAAASVAVLGVAVYWLLPPAERAVRVDQTAAVVPQSSARVESMPPPASELRVANAAPPPPLVAPKLDMPRPVQPQAIDFEPADAAAAVLPATTVSTLTDLPAAAVSPAQANPNEIVVTAGSSRPQAAMNSPVAVVTIDNNSKAGRAAESDELAEVSVTGSRRTSRLRGLFTRNRQAEPAAPPPVPTAENRDRFEHFEVNAVKLTREDPVSTFSVDVDTASYSFVRRQLNEGVLPPADAVRVEEMVNYFDYAWPVPASRQQPFQPTVTVSDSPWGEGRKLVHIGIKGYDLPAGERPDVNLVLLLDVSGSMNSPDKLPLAQRSMALLLDSLKPSDTVAIVVYAGAAGQVLAPTPVREKQAILDALNSLRPGGSTAGAAGIQLAYQLAERSFRKQGVNRILLATDGDFNVGITDREQLKSFVEREREKGVYLSVLGFGQGNYRDEMAQTLAQNGNGVAAYIDTLNEARKVLVEQAGSALFTIAKDVKLQVEFNPDAVAEYRLVGYETRALKREDFNNDKVDAGDVGAGHTVTAIYEITPVGSRGRMIEDSRYAERDTRGLRRQPSGEYGFLKIRYKLPDSTRSRLIETPIRADAQVPAALRQDVAFSTAVAGFGQLLRGGRYTGALTFDDVLRQAQAARGEDAFGYRAEFVQLVRRAQQARGL